jgi:RNA polymerase sigma-70 factor (ECF subfamily)
VTKIVASDQSLLVASLDPPAAPSVGRTVGLRELFEVHAPYVWNSLRRLGVRASDLEDLTHDLFIEVQRHLGDYDSSRPVRPWLFGFAFRLASEHRRRAFRRYEIQASPGDEGVDAAALPDEQLAIRQDRRLVLQALEAIDLDRRAVFVLYEIDGEPMSEIARSLGIPVNTAYSRLRLARTEFANAVKRLARKDGAR